MEKWKTIPDPLLRGDYQVSSLGNVRSKKTGTWINLKPQFNKHRGYLYISCQRGSYRKNYILHRLVAKTFLKNPWGFRVVDHKDFNRLNNNVNNLEWITSKENSRRVAAAGRTNTRYGDQVGRSKIKNKDIISIFKMRRSGASHKEIADKFGLKCPAISLILSGKRWSKVSREYNLIGEA